MFNIIILSGFAAVGLIALFTRELLIEKRANEAQGRRDGKDDYRKVKVAPGYLIPAPGGGYYRGQPCDACDEHEFTHVDIRQPRYIGEHVLGRAGDEVYYKQSAVDCALV